MVDMPTSAVSRRLGILAAVLVLTALWSPAEAVGAGSAPTHSTASTARTAPVQIDGHATYERKKKGAKRASFAWPGRTIRYYNALPAKWQWSATTAVRQWNTLGGKIRFVRTTRAKAQLVIGYGKIGRSAGLATVGRTTHAWVKLSASYAAKSALDAHNRVEVMDVVTHELGHVLGFDHTAARCSLMSPTMDVSGCAVVSDARPGYYACRTVDAKLAARFVKIYGGSVRRAPASWCLIAPLPSTLPGVVVDDDTSPEVRVTWQRPSYAPAGSRVSIKNWTADSCGQAPAWADSDFGSVAAGSWSENATTSSGGNCFSVQLVNRYGAGRTSTGARIQRFAESAAGDQG